MEVLYKIKLERFNTNFQYEYNDIITNHMIDNLDSINNIFDLESYSKMNGTEKHPYFKHKETSTTQEDFEKNYGNPMCGVALSRLTVVVEKNEDKVSMKIFIYQKHRSPGKVYFVKASRMNFITYKFSTNDLYCGNLINSFKKRRYSKSVKRNYFISKPVNSFAITLQNQLTIFKNNNVNYNSVDIMTEVIKVFSNQIPNFSNDFQYSLDENLYKHYLKIRNIKYPDNFLTFFSSFFPLPNKRFLKKSKYKLVDTFMMVNKLTGDKIRKILHTSNFINMNFYKQTENFFGEKYLKNQDENIIKNIFETKNGYTIPTIDEISPKEKNNSFSVFKEIIGYNKEKELKNQNHHLMYSFIDHINLYNRLKLLEPVKWKSNNIKDFNVEHSDWTDKYSYYTKGIYTRYYTEEFLTKLKEPLLDNYYPVVLTTSSEYNEESFRQSNCVKTYVDKCHSFCLSLRKGSNESENRATIEYHIRKDINGLISLSRVQSLGKFNSRLNDEWNLVLQNLDIRVNFLLRTTKFETPKVKVEIGNRVVESDSDFSDTFGLIWSSPYMKLLNSDYNNPLQF